MIAIEDLEEDDILDQLEDLFDDLNCDGPTDDQLYKMYGIFLRDFKKTPLILNGKCVKFNSKKSKHPLCKNKAQTFEHIITRESKFNNKRHFDKERANKIHWIKPIIENYSDKKIKYFKRNNADEQVQHFYWYEEKGFIIILREVEPDVMFITSFAVDKIEKQKFKKWYLENQ